MCLLYIFLIKISLIENWLKDGGTGSEKETSSQNHI